MKKGFLALLLALVTVFGLTGCEFLGIINNDSGNQNTGVTPPSITNNYTVNINVADVGEATDKPLTQVLEEICPSVVEVYIAQGDTLISAGSGVVIASGAYDEEGVLSEESFIITCHHIIENANVNDQVIIMTTEGKNYTAHLVGSDPDSDICVLSIDVKLPAVMLHGDSDLIKMGEDVVAIGNPIGSFGVAVTKGIVSAPCGDVTVDNKTMKLIQTDATINPGNSGGGLFTTSGYLIGMVTTKFLGSYSTVVSGLSYAIPANTISEIAKDLIEHGYIPGKYVIGCTVANYYTSKWGSQGYVYISSLDQSGCFYKSGLRSGDIIETITHTNDETGEEYVYTVSTASAFVEYINSLNLKIGDTLNFKIIRDSVRTIYVEVMITQYVYGA